MIVCSYQKNFIQTPIRDMQLLNQLKNEWELYAYNFLVTRGKQKSMSTATKQVIDLMEILPESEQNFALEFIKKLVLAWDFDYTKLTPLEQTELEEAIADKSSTALHDEINWD